MTLSSEEKERILADPFFRKVDDALRRAGELARRRAEFHNIPLVVSDDIPTCTPGEKEKETTS